MRAYGAPGTEAARWVAAHRALSLPYLLRGRIRQFDARFDGSALRVITAGRTKRLEPLLRRLFTDVTLTGAGSGVALWGPERLAAQHAGADLVAATIHRWAAPAFLRKGWLVAPELVRWIAPVSVALPTPEPESVLSDRRRAKRNGFTAEVVSARDVWDEYFRGMVAPYAAARHREHAWHPSPHLQRALALRGVIIFARQGDRRVAGCCAVPCGTRLWLALSGVLDGDLRHLRAGALAIAIVWVLDWARQHGFRLIDLGRTVPFQNDGVHAWKRRKWNLTPECDPLAQLVAFRVRPDSTAARAAFAREPLLVETRKALVRFDGGAVHDFGAVHDGGAVHDCGAAP